MAGGSTKAVYAAIGGNSVVMVAKFGAFLATGSGAMLSEGIHSFADVSNQTLLAIGIKKSERAADEDHPYGFARDQFIWALISAVGIFFLGCGVTLYHGVHALMHPEPLTNTETALGVLLFSFVVESWTLWVAWKAVSEAAKSANMSMRQYMVDGPDPMGVSVLLEDGAAVLGVMIAAAALGLALWTGNPVWDAVASITIGLLLGAIAIFLIYKNRQLLLGQSVSTERQQRLVDELTNDPVVENVSDVKATLIGSDVARFKAEIDFDGRAIARRHLDGLDLDSLFDQVKTRADLERILVEYGEHMVEALGDEVDRIEARLQAIDPGLQHVDLESS